MEGKISRIKAAKVIKHRVRGKTAGIPPEWLLIVRIAAIVVEVAFDQDGQFAQNGADSSTALRKYKSPRLICSEEIKCGPRGSVTLQLCSVSDRLEENRRFQLYIRPTAHGALHMVRSIFAVRNTLDHLLAFEEGSNSHRTQV